MPATAKVTRFLVAYTTGLIGLIDTENVETTRSLAAKTGMSRGRIQTVLAGDRSPASYGEVARLAAAFHVSPVSIIAEAEARLAAAHGENIEPVASSAPDINIERAG